MSAGKKNSIISAQTYLRIADSMECYDNLDSMTEAAKLKGGVKEANPTWTFSWTLPWKMSRMIPIPTSTPMSVEMIPRLQHRQSWRSESSLDDPDPSSDDDGVQLVFQASRSGKLGLTIQFVDAFGPVVTQVKDYSPVLGQVLQGDRIIDIDGIPTFGMSLKDVSSMMSGRIFQTNRWESAFRIVVWRQKNHDLPLRVNANPSL